MSIETGPPIQRECAVIFEMGAFCPENKAGIVLLFAATQALNFSFYSQTMHFGGTVCITNQIPAVCGAPPGVGSW